jgi:hypothetical protein
MRRRLIALLVCTAVAVVVIVVGRVESESATRTQNRAFARLLAYAGRHWSTTASAYRLAPAFDCLLYRSRADPYAVELCFDRSGHIVEAIDRRGASPSFWTLRFQPDASTVSVDPATLVQAFVDAGAVPRGTRSLPLGNPDRGPKLVEHKPVPPQNR